MPLYMHAEAHTVLKKCVSMIKNLQVCSDCGTGSLSEVWNLSFAYSATFMTTLNRIESVSEM